MSMEVAARVCTHRVSEPDVCGGACAQALQGAMWMSQRATNRSACLCEWWNRAGVSPHLFLGACVDACDCRWVCAGPYAIDALAHGGVTPRALFPPFSVFRMLDFSYYSSRARRRHSFEKADAGGRHWMCHPSLCDLLHGCSRRCGGCGPALWVSICSRVASRAYARCCVRPVSDGCQCSVRPLRGSARQLQDGCRLVAQRIARCARCAWRSGRRLDGMRAPFNLCSPYASGHSCQNKVGYICALPACARA
jgi:hypothetical protein